MPYPEHVGTERLALRRPRERDRGAWLGVWGDPAVWRPIAPGARPDPARALARFDHHLRHWDEHGFGLWALVPREGDAGCIGFAGLAIPSFLPAILPAVEVGWRLAPDWWGRGLGTEAARASVAFGFDELALRSIVSVIDERNERSLRLAARLGMRRGADRLHPVTRRRLRVMRLERPAD